MQLPVSMATLKEQTFQESWKLGDGRGRNVDGTNDLEPHILSTSRCQHRSGHGLLLLPSCSISPSLLDRLSDVRLLAANGAVDVEAGLLRDDWTKFFTAQKNLLLPEL